MKYLNQHRYPYMLYKCDTDHPDNERLHNSTFYMTACGLCCAVMVADRLLIGPKFDLVDALQLSYDCGANHAPGTDYKLYAPALCEKLGLRYEGTNDMAVVKRCLETGGCVVANSGGDRDGYTGVFTHGGHYICVISVREDGKFCVLDPSQEPDKFDEPGREGKVEVDGNFIYCDGAVLAKDCENRDPGLWCFWRK
ncbi:MAG: hypothetical protein IJL27_03810 [Firmicutes bacterium]|nr:hypothetical protein [Bacillota bacterium]